MFRSIKNRLDNAKVGLIIQDFLCMFNAPQSRCTTVDDGASTCRESHAPVVQLVKGLQKAKPSYLNTLLLKATLIVEKIDVSKAVSW